MLHNAGDLENVLKQQRAKEQSLPENILKKWVGQMVEALAFVHSKKVIHRDLKPSNIFMTTNLDISIGRYSFS
jgi:serine/threonine protein kinase